MEDKGYLRASYVGALASLGVASCCVLPMVMLVLGLGGSWLAVFGKIAATSYYVLVFSTLRIVLAGIVAYRRGSLSRLRKWLTGSALLTGLAWGIVLNETRLNDLVMTWM